jgi:hypothetical protein
MLISSNSIFSVPFTFNAAYTLDMAGTHAAMRKHSRGQWKDRVKDRLEEIGDLDGEFGGGVIDLDTEANPTRTRRKKGWAKAKDSLERVSIEGATVPTAQEARSNSPASPKGPKRRSRSPPKTRKSKRGAHEFSAWPHSEEGKVFAATFLAALLGDADSHTETEYSHKLAVIHSARIRGLCRRTHCAHC